MMQQRPVHQQPAYQRLLHQRLLLVATHPALQCQRKRRVVQPRLPPMKQQQQSLMPRAAVTRSVPLVRVVQRRWWFRNGQQQNRPLLVWMKRSPRQATPVSLHPRHQPRRPPHPHPMKQRRQGHLRRLLPHRRGCRQRQPRPPLPRQQTPPQPPPRHRQKPLRLPPPLPRRQ